MSNLIYQSQLPGGSHWSLRIPKGTLLRLTDIEGGANLGMLFYNPLNLLERYNAPDTLKCQHTFRLTAGHCLYSDMGHIFCSIIEDSTGWIDTVGGSCDKAKVSARWGERDYQHDRNLWLQNGHDSFLVEVAKYGLGERDLAANLNLFSKLAVSDEGTLSYVSDHSPAGSTITLRFEMDTLVVMHSCPHPLNPAKEYPRKPVAYALLEAEPVAADDLCLNSRPENGRGFANNARYLCCAHH